MIKGGAAAVTARMLAWKQPPFKECVTAHWSSGRASIMTGHQAAHRSHGVVVWITFDYDRYQMTLFVLDSFEQLFEAAARLEHSILEGTLGEVAPGQPETSDADLASFLRGGA